MSRISWVPVLATFHAAYCVKTCSKRTYTRVKTQSLCILSALSLCARISFSDFLSELSSVPSAYRDSALVGAFSRLADVQPSEKIAVLEFAASFLPRFAALPPSADAFEAAPAFLLRAQQLARSVLRAADFPAVHGAAIRLLAKFPAVLLEFPRGELSFDAALREAMATLRTAEPREASVAAGIVAEMLSGFVARSREKPRVRGESEVEAGVSSGGVSVETAVQWLLGRLQQGGAEPRG